eukprot:TRINITY_DN6751_c0_g1_i4.p1 TRINITY_DN6751_c0_g1~~TRINITY_DN6751_c0_g1_i4.p1  ORF type:complete len:237 (+),score=96.07 TRINITY_DN6751_c0_g1_i4:131-841(+)
MCIRDRFKAFDINGDGTIGADELLVLGRQRRKLGQKSGEWTKEMNNRLMAKLDKNGDGRVQVREFVDFFDEQLPSVNNIFHHHCDAFLEVAQSIKAAPAPAAPSGGRVSAAKQAVDNVPSGHHDDEEDSDLDKLTLGLFSKTDTAEPAAAAAEAEAVAAAEAEAVAAAEAEAEQEEDEEFDKWDANNDGVIDRQEFTKMRAAAAQDEAEQIRSEAQRAGRGKLGAMKDAILRAAEQ